MAIKLETRLSFFTLVGVSFFFLFVFDFTTINHGNFKLRNIISTNLDFFNLLNEVHTNNDSSENNMFAVQPRSFLESDEKLRTVGVGSGIRHTEQPGDVMFASKMFILEFLAVDTLSSGTITSSEISSLHHEALDNSVEFGILEMQRFTGISDTLLTSAQSSEVLNGFRASVGIQLKLYSLSLLAEFDVHEHMRILGEIGNDNIAALIFIHVHLAKPSTISVLFLRLVFTDLLLALIIFCSKILIFRVDFNSGNQIIPSSSQSTGVHVTDSSSEQRFDVVTINLDSFGGIFDDLIPRFLLGINHGKVVMASNLNGFYFFSIFLGGQIFKIAQGVRVLIRGFLPVLRFNLCVSLILQFLGIFNLFGQRHLPLGLSLGLELDEFNFEIKGSIGGDGRGRSLFTVGIRGSASHNGLFANFHGSDSFFPSFDD
mmetsp:Transcript_24385/g.27688  ORF Transcript_24385/g.27688 Transcript_24385/m.27688 type:complete len:429 (-) Transcript_24385:245-1531(-)